MKVEINFPGWSVKAVWAAVPRVGDTVDLSDERCAGPSGVVGSVVWFADVVRVVIRAEDYLPPPDNWHGFMAGT